MKRYSPYSLSRLHLVQNLDQHPLTEAQKNLQREYLLKEVEEKQQEKQIFTPGEVFDPKTAAAEISQLPKEARADALRDYYNKFQHQMFGWSSFTEFITEQAIMDPDLTDAEFEKALNTYKNLFAFSDSHVNLAQVFQERYKTKREAITQVTQEYGTDQQALSKAIFGREYNKLQIYPTPLAFICFTSDNPTFNQIYGGDNRQSSGYTLGTVYNPNLSHQVIVIRDNADPDPQMVKHELQHTLYELFPHPYGNLEVDPLEVGRVVDAFQQNTQTPTRLEQIKIAISKKLGKENGPNPAIQPETLLNQLLEKVQEGGLGLVHNELLAYFKQGVDPEFVTQMLHASPQNQLYGYFNTFYSTTYQDMLSHLDEESQHTIRRATHQVLHDGYNKTITAAVDAMHRLMAEGNYNRDQVIGSLRSYPASEWPKTVIRLLKGEGNK